MYMSNGDGFDVISTLRREVPVPKIIVVSGKSSDDLLTAAKLIGADLVLTKPVTMDQLLKAVQTVLGTLRTLGKPEPDW